MTSFSVWLIVFASGTTDSSVPHGMIASSPGSEYVTSHNDSSGLHTARKSSVALKSGRRVTSEGSTPPSATLSGVANSPPPGPPICNASLASSIAVSALSLFLTPESTVIAPKEARRRTVVTSEMTFRRQYLLRSGMSKFSNMTSVGAGASSTWYANLPRNRSSDRISQRSSQLLGDALRHSTHDSSSEKVTNASLVLNFFFILSLMILSSTTAIFSSSLSMVFSPFPVLMYLLFATSCCIASALLFL